MGDLASLTRALPYCSSITALPTENFLNSHARIYASQIIFADFRILDARGGFLLLGGCDWHDAGQPANRHLCTMPNECLPCTTGKLFFMLTTNDIDNLINSKKLYCSVWNEIKNWIELFEITDVYVNWKVNERWIYQSIYWIHLSIWLSTSGTYVDFFFSLRDSYVSCVCVCVCSCLLWTFIVKNLR